MFKIQLRKSVERTIDYFLKDKELSAEEKRGVWIGSGTDALELGNIPYGPGSPSSSAPVRDARGRIIVTEEDLRPVLQGYAPPSGIFPGRPLNARYVKRGRRCAWDCTISPDKSVSIAALCLPDDFSAHRLAIRSAYDSAIQESFSFMQCLARRTNGARPDIETGSLLAARFDHEASRRNDPNLHTHLLLMNATCEPYHHVYKRWYSLETIQFYRQVREIDLVFQRALTWHLRASGFEANLQKVDGLPIAVLPAVPLTICGRLSRAHLAIQEKVGNQWKREKRELSHKRAENMFNEDLRPAKKGTLAGRKNFFNHALCSEEIAQIVTKLGPVIDSGRTPLKLPYGGEVAQQILQAARRLGYCELNPGRLTRAALVASAGRMDIPFLPYWDIARQTLGRMLAEPVNAQEWEDYAHSVGQYWQTELEDTVLDPRSSPVNQRPESRTERTRSQSISAPQPALAGPGHETIPASAGAENVLETLPQSDLPNPTEAGLLAPALHPYALPVEPDLPDDQQEHSGPSL